MADSWLRKLLGRPRATAKQEAGQFDEIIRAQQENYAAALANVGWVAHHEGQHGVVYIQMVDGEACSIEIDGERLNGTPHHVLYLPSQAEWDGFPEWAQRDREIILERIRETFPEPGYEYEG
jgi:hypothetical protein